MLRIDDASELETLGRELAVTLPVHDPLIPHSATTNQY
jgi:hypothetical protein